MWQCKECSLQLASRYLLLQHFRQVHGHLRGSYRYPCPYTDCPCTFNTWSKLLNHTYKSHGKHQGPNPVEGSTFQCHVCSCRELATERAFFQHINGHLRHDETVPCMFVGCTFKTNVYSTFNTHKNRKHNQHSLKDFKANVIRTSQLRQSINLCGSSMVINDWNILQGAHSHAQLSTTPALLVLVLFSSSSSTPAHADCTM